MTLRCGCGSEEWVAAAPGAPRYTTRDDNPHVLLIKPSPAKRTKVWCMACWPYLQSAAHKRAALQCR